MSLTVLRPGPLTTVQDGGRPGLAALGVGRSGACDRAAWRLANRLVANPEDAAALEVTLGGLELRAGATVSLAVTGARCPGAPHNAPLTLRAGQTLRLGTPEAGLRSYVAVHGGVDVPPVLGSRSRDVLAGIGPEPLAEGTELALGPSSPHWPDVDVAPVPDPPAGTVRVRVLPGPRRDWFGDQGWRALCEQAWTVSVDSDRVGLRLEGGELARTRDGELASEGMARGGLQVPPSGLPVLFLADHPVTGGYPVIGYVHDDDVDRCGQLRPGQRLRLRPVGQTW